MKESLEINETANLFFIENPISLIFRDFEASPENSIKMIFIGDFVPRKNVIDLL